MSLFGILIMPFKLRRVLPIAKPLENRSSSDTGEPLCYRIDMRYSNTILDVSHQQSEHVISCRQGR
jgi:hypothetical protein